MKNAVYLTVLSIVVLFYSCGNSGKCADVIENGAANANSSYNELKSNAEFTLIESDDEITIAMSFVNAINDCFLNSGYYFYNLSTITKDTIYLKMSPYIGNVDAPTVKYYIYDGDATEVEAYLLLDSTNIKNWVIFDSINSDTTEIKGRFNMSFLTSNEKILSGERERWDDPNRPDILHFFDGEFMAARIN